MDMEENMPELWDNARLADYLGVGERFIRRICADGRIRYLRVGGRRRFDPVDVAQYIDNEKRGAAPNDTGHRRFGPVDVAQYISREKRGAAPNDTGHRSSGRPKDSERRAR